MVVVGPHMYTDTHRNTDTHTAASNMQDLNKPKKHEFCYGR